MPTNSAPPEYQVGGQYQAALGVFVLDALGNIVSSFGGGSGGGGTSASVTLLAGTAHAGSVNVDNFPATQPVSGSVAVTGSPAIRTNDAGTNRNQTHDDTLAMAQAGGGVRVLQAGTTGTDYSVNAVTVPGTTPLITIPVSATRAFVEIQNQSVANVQLVRDDGAGNNQTSIIMAPAATAGGQGGGWSSATFKGRIRVFGAAGAQISAYQD